MRVMTWMRAGALALTALGLAVAAPAPKPVSASSLGEARDGAIGATLAGPPAPDSATDREDRAAVLAAQRPGGSPRWLIAQADAELEPGMALSRFDCPLGVRLRPDERPALTRLFTREFADALAAWTPAKARWMRPRPTVALALAPCVTQDPRAPGASSYPAGHAVAAELWGRALAELAPDRAQAIAARVREIGRSRVVCALHYPSDVAAGAELGARLYEAVRAEPAFQADLAAARVELAAARADGRTNPGCTAERAGLEPEGGPAPD